MPIRTVRFQTDLVGFPKQARDIDLPPSLNHRRPDPGKKLPSLPRLGVGGVGWGSGEHVAKLTSRLAGTSEHGLRRENQSRPAGDAGGAARSPARAKAAPSAGSRGPRPPYPQCPWAAPWSRARGPQGPGFLTAASPCHRPHLTREQSAGGALRAAVDEPVAREAAQRSTLCSSCPDPEPGARPKATRDPELA